jgi:hypothetical protein
MVLAEQLGEVGWLVIHGMTCGKDIGWKQP